MHGTPDNPAPAPTVWEDNATVWTEAVRQDQIASRVAVTNNAILASIAARAPHTVLDIGCGEGWLCREVKHRIGSETLGLDGSEALIAAARDADPSGVYAKASYEELIQGRWPESCWEGTFDAVVFNFALFDENPTPLLESAATRLTPNGAVLIQTLSAEILQDGPAGWRHESFAEFGGSLWKPMDWYCHDLESLTARITVAGLTPSQIHRTKARDSSDPRERSMMIVATKV